MAVCRNDRTETVEKGELGSSRCRGVKWRDPHATSDIAPAVVAKFSKEGTGIPR
jgi:hypothetical protein